MDSPTPLRRAKHDARVLVAVLVVVAALAWLARELENVRLIKSPGDLTRGWYSADADSHYHMRRLERALEEGLPIAERDPYLDFPHGAAIPWPPYYAYLLYATLAPFAPSDASARKEFIEHAVAYVPCVCAVFAAIVIALAAWRLARNAPLGARTLAALLAGGYYALLAASFEYSAIGIGDHHAWVALLLALLLALSARAFEEEALASPRTSAKLGAALGLVAGAMLGSWVGGLAYVALIQVALGFVALSNAKRPRAGFAALGFWFHLAWALAVAPAVLGSPWKDEHPWMTINLSWLHLAHPLLGALLFVPLLVVSDKARLARAWPWLAGAFVAVLALLVAFSDFAFARGVRDGFAWAGRSNTFMAFIAESQPLGWGQIGGVRVVSHSLGLGVALLALVWPWIAWRAWKQAELALVPLAVALPPLLVQALVQRRFADAFGVPMSIALGLCLAIRMPAEWCGRSVLRVFALGLVALVPLQWLSVRSIAHRSSAGQRYLVGPQAQNLRAYRELYHWIRDHDAQRESNAVLASWDHGHSIEWAAEHPSIATNFGSYLGEDSYLDPWRFFLSEDPRAAEEILVRRRARFVLITGEFSKDLEVMLRVLRPEERRSFLLIPREGPVYVSQRFLGTVAGRLMMQGRVGDLEKRELVGDSLDFVRLVHLSAEKLATELPIRHTNGPVPAGWVWERVEGARVEANGMAGTVLRLSLEVEYPGPWPKLTWVGSAPCDASGVARVRVPYCTDESNGEGRPLSKVRWTIGERSGEIEVPERAVETGEVVRIEH